jgi:hypothetical protein
MYDNLYLLVVRENVWRHPVGPLKAMKTPDIRPVFEEESLTVWNIDVGNSAV